MTQLQLERSAVMELYHQFAHDTIQSIKGRLNDKTPTPSTLFVTGDLQTEWTHVYETRVGIFCGAGEPTEAQQQIAMTEADNHINALVASKKYYDTVS